MREHQVTAFRKPANAGFTARGNQKEAVPVSRPERGGGQVLFFLPLGRGSWSSSGSSLRFHWGTRPFQIRRLGQEANRKLFPAPRPFHKAGNGNTRPLESRRCRELIGTFPKPAHLPPPTTKLSPAMRRSAERKSDTFKFLKFLVAVGSGSFSRHSTQNLPASWL